MQDLRNKIIDLLKAKGPCLPIQGSKSLGTNSIMAGAILATLLEQKHLKISNAKIGGSPVYYLEGQENKLGQTLYPHMKEVHKKAYDLLKKNIVLEDRALDPVNRVALRELGDFAKKLTIYTGEIFWKFHLVDDKDAEEKIKGLVDFQEETVEEEKEEDPAKEQGDVKEDLIDKQQEVVEVKTQDIVNEQKIDVPKIEVKIETNPIEVNPEENDDDELEEDEEEIKPKKKSKKIKEKPEVKPKAKKEIVKEKKEDKKKQKLEKNKEEVDEFFNAVDEYFNGKKIEVIEGNIINKGKEYEFIVQVPSNVGKVKFFVKYRNKKAINEGDLGLALNIAFGKKLPLLFIANGNLNAKAKEYAEKNGIVFETI